MYFFVDESGHTGTNLFDENQPLLYYGVLSASTNLDVVAGPFARSARKKLGSVRRLHAADMGVGGLATIADDLVAIQRRYKPRFDVYRVAKADHALICFFDQVFDQGLNPAVSWTGYWTPLRYVLLLKVAHLFDEDTLKLAWSARITKDSKSAENDLIQVCQTIKDRVPALPDQRSRELIGDALSWAIKNPSKLHYNCQSKDDILSISPNVIGFQFVMHGIARRIRNPRGASRIVVDRQSQFNKAQRTLAEFYASARQVPWVTGPGLPEMDLSKIPDAPIEFCAGTESVGLELVDVYLWLFKRVLEGKEVPPELGPIIRKQLHRGRTDEISINALSARWSRVFENMPEPTQEQAEAAKEILELQESRRLQAVRELHEKS